MDGAGRFPCYDTFSYVYKHRIVSCRHRFPCDNTFRSCSMTGALSALEYDLLFVNKTIFGEQVSRSCMFDTFCSVRFSMLHSQHSVKFVDPFSVGYPIEHAGNSNLHTLVVLTNRRFTGDARDM